jgi:hypothetical protein
MSDTIPSRSISSCSPYGALSSAWPTDNLDSQSQSSKQATEPDTSIVEDRPQSLIFAMNHPGSDISHLSQSDRTVVQSCWKESSVPDTIGTAKTLEHSESALALLQAACLRRASQTRPLPDKLSPWVEVVGTDHMQRLLSSENVSENAERRSLYSEKGSENAEDLHKKRVMEATEVLCSRIVGSVM